MGIAPAVFCANFYCYTYELDFFHQLITPGNTQYTLLSEFRLYSRYVDDILSLLNNVIEDYLYQSKTDDNGIHGIFPDELIINIENDSYSSIPYMDQLIYHDRNQPTLLQHTIYDKGEHAPLNTIKRVQYPHPSSFLSASSMYNVLTSQIHRFIYLCSTREEFIYWTRKVIDKLLTKGYNPTRLQTISHRQLQKARYRYGMRTMEGVQLQIWNNMRTPTPPRNPPHTQLPTSPHNPPHTT